MAKTPTVLSHSVASNADQPWDIYNGMNAIALRSLSGNPSLAWLPMRRGFPPFAHYAQRFMLNVVSVRCQ